ncbi:uncharacterized protein LOC105226973 [Bactrocera dorsalis]|uniref:Uncharacterized protein LOC105226973 n=1 Tax=Bactrocera dorsalis TaxID=27457 RepID=A0A6J0RHV6_BACDO|nr:uncharacterized protein LOC105226973 [Bactrocera dorsalis]XP_019846333.2 uncharacterized protein LOC105226973 [Bactrocera dorsalis]XP_019846335.2 uncharacterized protein LOC105226973 [Bactrocera dorsalis]XP_019846338.2 uncharacterized protein LOC105226973 [Bactrocera dorsalis]XP_019846345.2 uncharacterized protein LOC105226973 [Bactrocera dorsalis]XP_019846356.2 uncharacterized protein LOC105226973 [Bactrocera dorsalis]XP_049306122.1 uncharacterized protein LOC105226973 [Bactrocera dorsali
MCSAISIALLYWFIFYTANLPQCCGHGRLIEPPSRATAWRYGFQTPPNYNDHELYCGGFTRQWKQNNGKCGECGDAWDLPKPRPHESGGFWGKGVIVRKYSSESVMLIRVELTASHMGYFEFRICSQPYEQQECFDQHLLKVESGFPSQSISTDLETRFYPRNGSLIYNVKVQLPKGLNCNHCVLQWRYIAGNNWGICPDGNGAVGCGPQEEFRACSDIVINDPEYKPDSPSKPRATESPKHGQTPTKEHFDEFNFIKLMISLILLVILFITVGVGFLFRAKITRYVKTNLYTRLRKAHPFSLSNIASKPEPSLRTISSSMEGKTSNSAEIKSSLTAPIPPPRSKRNLHVENNHSFTQSSNLEI